MNDLNTAAQRYVDLWNQPDDTLRAALIAADWQPDATYVDPLVSAEGAQSLNATIAAVRKQFPGHRFERHGEADGHGPHLRFSWALMDAAGAVAARGTDFATRGADGRYRSVTGFLDFVAAAPAAAQA